MYDETGSLPDAVPAKSVITNRATYPDLATTKPKVHPPSRATVRTAGSCGSQPPRAAS